MFSVYDEWKTTPPAGWDDDEAPEADDLDEVGEQEAFEDAVAEDVGCVDDVDEWEVG